MRMQSKPLGVEVESSSLISSKINTVGMLFGVPALFGTNGFILTLSHLHPRLDINGNIMSLSGEVAQAIHEKCETFADVAELLMDKEVVVQIIPYKRWAVDKIVNAHTFKLDWAE